MACRGRRRGRRRSRSGSGSNGSRVALRRIRDARTAAGTDRAAPIGQSRPTHAAAVVLEGAEVAVVHRTVVEARAASVAAGSADRDRHRDGDGREEDEQGARLDEHVNRVFDSVFRAWR